jgi:hypothetical protein
MKKPLDEARQAYLKEMEKERGYLLDFHKILAEEDFEFQVVTGDRPRLNVS